VLVGETGSTGGEHEEEELGDPLSDPLSDARAPPPPQHASRRARTVVAGASTSMGEHEAAEEGRVHGSTARLLAKSSPPCPPTAPSTMPLAAVRDEPTTTRTPSRALPTDVEITHRPHAL
jgi:hypothetical protein